MTTYTQDQVDELIEKTRNDTIRELSIKCQNCPMIISPETRKKMDEHTSAAVDFVMRSLG